MYIFSVYHYEVLNKKENFNYTEYISKLLQEKLDPIYYNDGESVIESLREILSGSDDIIVKDVTSTVKVDETYIDDNFLKFTIGAANKEKTSFNIAIIFETNNIDNSMRTLGSYVFDDVKFNDPKPSEIPITLDMVIRLENME